MSDILKPDGEPAREARPSNEATLDFIARQKAEQDARELGDKIVDLQEAKQNAETHARRMKQFQTAVLIVSGQLVGDAKVLEELAKDAKTSVNDMHMHMDSARAMRITVTYLQGLIASQSEADAKAAGANDEARDGA